MKKIISIFLPLLFVFISCFPWDVPEAGNLYGYEIVFDKSNVSNGYIDLKISGSLDSKHKNPVLYLSMEKDLKNIPTDSYDLGGDAQYLTHTVDSKNNEYCIWLGSGDIDYTIRINLQNPGNYGIFCWIFADRTNESNCDHYFNCLEFTYE